MFSSARQKITGMIRIIIVAIAIVAQLLLLALIVMKLKESSFYIYTLLELFGIVIIIAIVARNRNDSYTITWLIIIILLPVFGYLLYFLWGKPNLEGWRVSKIRKALSAGEKYLSQDQNVSANIQTLHPYRRRLADFLWGEGFPLYGNTQCKYYPLGELQFEQMIEDMEKAQRFIFLEYFILSEGQLWDRIHDVLKSKAEQGVEVRLMYDDMGSLITAPNVFDQFLKDENIKVVRFNPIHRHIFRLFINYRNHQKITVIDGNIGYTGGCNLADEYANLYQRFGHWKDTGIRLEGDAVWGLTVTFLQMWESEAETRDDYNDYKPTQPTAGAGFFQPFTDSPINNPDNPAETMYSQIISNAREYVYITTPYLVIDYSMREALCIAARSGIDVRIITPKIGDHWYVHQVTNSNYGPLLRAGVRIYEYSPGYIHAKSIISDDDHGIIGSINMDYRSFNLHFENAVWICGAPVLEDIKRDITDTFMISEEINLDDWQGRPWHLKATQTFLRLFAPLL